MFSFLASPFIYFFFSSWGYFLFDFLWLWNNNLWDFFFLNFLWFWNHLLICSFLFFGFFFSNFRLYWNWWSNWRFWGWSWNWSNNFWSWGYWCWCCWSYWCSWIFFFFILSLLFLHDSMLLLLVFDEILNLLRCFFSHRFILFGDLDGFFSLVDLVFHCLICGFDFLFLLLFSFLNILSNGSFFSDLLLFFKIFLVVDLLLSLLLCFLDIFLFFECFFSINVKLIFFGHFCCVSILFLCELLQFGLQFHDGVLCLLEISLSLIKVVLCVGVTSVKNGHIKLILCNLVFGSLVHF